ncbi:MAG: monofunctional biosynthetic peptidoglycan transglycosylase [Hyphomonas sp.]
MSDYVTEGKPKRDVPLWRRLLVGAVQAAGAVFLLFHLYALALKFLPAPGTILMTQRAGQGEDVRRNWKSLDQISPNLVLAVISAEDAKFCDHGGIDWDAIEQAREWNAKNPDRSRRGGSTISQQTAKNVFLWPGGGMPRKAGEAWMTYVIETVWGKRRIMEVYLNVAEWGDGLFGAEAAAQARFGKAAADLTPLEAARLAAIQSRMRVVANEGYAACVLGDDFRSTLPKPGKGDAPRPPPVFEDLPDAPDEGEEAISEAAPAVNQNDVLNDILNSADETFNTEPLPEPAPEVPAEEPAEEPTPTDPPADESGPTVLTPE